MLATVTPVPAERSAGTLTTTGRATTPAPTGGPRFAELLQRGQASHGVLARPAEDSASRAELPPADGADRESGAAAPAATRPAARGAATRTGAKPSLRLHEKVAPTAPAASALTPDVSTDTSSHDLASPAAPAIPGSAPTGALPVAEARAWLAAPQPPGQAAAGGAGIELHRPGTAADVAEAASRDPTGANGGTSTPSRAPTDAPHGAAASEDPTAGAGCGAASSAERAPPATLAPSGAELALDARRPATHEAAAIRDATQPMLVGVGGAVPRGLDPATLAPIALPAPLHSPEFAQALGAQVSVLARGGVQQAELHLNPAEMGPISVQIHLDGEQARVDFSADAAATREVIERSLPELASALREQGLTLAGGGVFQQAPDPRDGADGEPAQPSTRSRSRITAPTAATARALSILPQGRLDLYA